MNTVNAVTIQEISSDERPLSGIRAIAIFLPQLTITLPFFVPASARTAWFNNLIETAIHNVQRTYGIRRYSAENNKLAPGNVAANNHHRKQVQKLSTKNKQRNTP
ncbi:hypothetical protein ACUYOF_17665 [Photobacterium ganghwense]|uniref:hypothetical protein n=1 Tax=Photobacterium ganghwense TaxID=320778 RepID=UPI0040565340